MKPLTDGQYALGAFNRNDAEKSVTFSWKELKLEVPSSVRKVWENEEVNEIADEITLVIPTHGVVLLQNEGK